MVIGYHDNDDLHGTVHVRNLLLRTSRGEMEKYVGYGQWKGKHGGKNPDKIYICD